MRSGKMSSGILLGAAFLLLASVAAADVKETEEFSFDIDPDGRISLENINGDILISGGGDGKVSIIARKRAGRQEYMDGLKVVVDADSGYIRIETRHPKGSGSHFSWGDKGGGSVSYELEVPATVNLDKISTVNGEIEIRSVSGKVKAETVNGDLLASGLMSDVDLETVNGGVKAVFDSLGSGQRVSAEAVNGKVVLQLPADASARIHAETVNGRIDADDFGLQPDKGFVGRELDGEIGNGDARVSLDTVNGSIVVSKK